MAALDIVTTTHSPAELDTALSSAVLYRVASGVLGPTMRLFVPERTVAFGSQDRIRPGYLDAIAAVRGLGFSAIERLAGGKAAVFHEGTLAFAWATPEVDSKTGIERRFEELTAIVVDALGRLGLVASVGETPGEYCPGRFSVYVAGRKVMGVGQRLVNGAAHIGGVLVVHSPDLINRPLIPAYDHLGYEWSHTATGSLSDADPISVVQATAAMVQAIDAAGHDLVSSEFDQATLDLAATLAPDHAAPIA